MRRRLLSFLTALSLLLCAAVIVLWLRSYRVGERLNWKGVRDEPALYQWREVSLSSRAGGVALSARTSTETGPGLRRHGFAEPLGFTRRATPHPSYPRRVDGPRFDFDRWGFAWNRRVTDGPTTSGANPGGRRERFAAYSVVIPYWSALLPTAALPLYRGLKLARVRMRRRRTGRGLCPGCGYDLRASQDRCPECGVAVRTKEVTSNA